MPGLSVSVVVTVLNGEAFVDRCLDALATQTLRPREIVVIDDGSTDATSSKLVAARERHGDMVRLHRHGNRGAAASLNVAHSMCSGNYIANADVDDDFPPDRLAKSVALMEANGADLGGGQVDGWLDVGWRRRPLRFAVSRFATDPGGIADRLVKGLDPLPHATMIVRRDAVARFGGYRRLFQGEDLELMLRWARLGARIAVSPDVLASYRFRPEFFALDTQTRWMLNTRYAREVAACDDSDVPDFAAWLQRAPLRAARREAFVRVVRLGGRLAVGELEAVGVRRRGASR